MAYASLGELKAYLGITDTADDELLTQLIDMATAVIESYTRRVFVAYTKTRHYGPESINGPVLSLGEWLLSVTELKDGQGNVIPSEGYELLPKGGKRFWGIRLRPGWQWNCDREHDVTVTGSWGWSETPPPDIVLATLRLAAYFYRQKDAQVFDVTAAPGLGTITIPKGMPADVKLILDQYKEVG